MKTKLILFLLLLGPTFVLSQTYYMHVKKTNGSTVTYPITDISNITFALTTGISNDDCTKLSEALSTLALLQSRPNPFSANTTIDYQLPKAGKVTLKIYNISGQLVKTLVDGTQASGAYSVRWNGHNDQSRKVTAGSYIYRLSFDDKNLTQKLIYLE